MDIKQILAKDSWTTEELAYLIGLEEEADCQALYEAAYKVKEKYIGRFAYFRGLIEFSNQCIKNCLYCGIRRDNEKADRFCMSREDILRMAAWAYEHKYGSVTLQSGERSDEAFISFVESVLKDIKKIGDGSLGITLCVGEQTEETYRRFFEAGAHRYLLRIESSDPQLYHTIHPKDALHSWHTRVDCLHRLRRAGFQVGTGIMSGLPGQTPLHLAKDVEFFKEMNIDMIGMGPYVVHGDTPLGQQVIQAGLDTEEARMKRLRLGLNMIAVTRLYLKDVNIAVTTSLQALHPKGREWGLLAGGNILMPILTVPEHKKKYLLYQNKPAMEATETEIKDLLVADVERAGDTVGFGRWGDSPHFAAQQKKNKD